MTDGVAFNHVGQCVTDLARARRFYEQLLGFTFEREIKPPDEPSDRLLRLEPPVGMTAVYLRRDGLVLELLHFDRTGPSRSLAGLQASGWAVSLLLPAR